MSRFNLRPRPYDVHEPGPCRDFEGDAGHGEQFIHPINVFNRHRIPQSSASRPETSNADSWDSEPSDSDSEDSDYPSDAETLSNADSYSDQDSDSDFGDEPYVGANRNSGMNVGAQTVFLVFFGSLAGAILWNGVAVVVGAQRWW